MKIKITLAKPRNPVVMQARTRAAGAHDAYRPERRERRSAKHQLYLQVSGRLKDGER